MKVFADSPLSFSASAVSVDESLRCNFAAGRQLREADRLLAWAILRLDRLAMFRHLRNLTVLVLLGW